MSAQERCLRSGLVKLLQWEPFLHGTLSPRDRSCGNLGCRCQTGKKHPCLVILRTRENKLQQLYVPKDWEEQGREWVKNYRKIVSSVGKISQIYWNKIKQRKR